MSAKLRDEIEAKRAKLQELRQARLARQRQDSERRTAVCCPLCVKYQPFKLLQTPVRSPTQTDVNALLSSILGPDDTFSPRSPDLTPASSVPGTPSLGHPDLPGPASLRVSGRVSRISSAGSDRASLGATLVQSATENVVDRCVCV